jgi:hypothetical protein
MAFARSFLRLSFAVFLAALGSALWAADSRQIEAELQRIAVLQATLDSGGIDGLLDQVRGPQLRDRSILTAVSIPPVFAFRVPHSALFILR